MTTKTASVIVENAKVAPTLIHCPIVLLKPTKSKRIVVIRHSLTPKKWGQKAVYA